MTIIHADGPKINIRTDPIPVFRYEQLPEDHNSSSQNQLIKIIALEYLITCEAKNWRDGGDCNTIMYKVNNNLITHEALKEEFMRRIAKNHKKALEKDKRVINWFKWMSLRLTEVQLNGIM